MVNFFPADKMAMQLDFFLDLPNIYATTVNVSWSIFLLLIANTTKCKLQLFHRMSYGENKCNYLRVFKLRLVIKLKGRKPTFTEDFKL